MFGHKVDLNIILKIKTKDAGRTPAGIPFSLNLFFRFYFVKATEP